MVVFLPVSDVLHPSKKKKKKADRSLAKSLVVPEDQITFSGNTGTSKMLQYSPNTRTIQFLRHTISFSFQMLFLPNASVNPSFDYDNMLITSWLVITLA